MIGAAIDKQVLSLIGELFGILDLDELSLSLMHSLRALVPSDWCAIHEVPADLPRTISLTDPPMPEESHELFARLAPQNPIAAYFLRTRDGRATRISDLIDRREYHALDIYRQLYRPLGVEHQIAFTLPSGADRILGVALSRGREDFSTAERDLLNVARPYLIQIYRNALTHSRLAAETGEGVPLRKLEALGLTRREAEVLALIAVGHSAPQAAVVLGIAPRTVHKHLEGCYRALDVNNRADAARAALAAAGRPGASHQPAAH